MIGNEVVKGKKRNDQKVKKGREVNWWRNEECEKAHNIWAWDLAWNQHP